MKARRKWEKEWEGSNVWRNVYNFLEVVKDINSQIQEAQVARQTNRKKKKKSKFRHITVKLQHMKGKAKILTASTEKGEISFKRTIVRLPTKFLTAKWKPEWKKNEEIMNFFRLQKWCQKEILKWKRYYKHMKYL